MKNKESSSMMMLGDSLVEFYNWQTAFPDVEVINLGCSGETVAELVRRSGKIISRYPAPDLVVIMTGTNNVAMEDFIIIPAYREIIKTLSHAWPAAGLVVNSLMPMVLSHLAPGTVREINEKLKNLARETAGFYLDVWSQMTETDGRARPGLLSDEVHLSDRGYDVWVQVLSDFLNTRRY